jgi:hypothetical protein
MPSNPFVTRIETTPPVDIVGVACLANSDSGFLRSQNWWRILGMRLGSWKENAAFSLENTQVTGSKESVSIEIKCESQVDPFLRYWRNCSSRVRVSRPHCKLGIRKRFVTKRRATKTAGKVKERICAASWERSVSHVSCYQPVSGW